MQFDPGSVRPGVTEPARRVLLPEDDVLLGPVQCPPSADATLQCAADVGTDLGMASPDLAENGGVSPVMV